MISENIVLVEDKKSVKKVSPKRKTTEQFVRDAEALHKDADGNPLYLYDKTIYVKQDDKVIITCKLHGDFLQGPKNHLQGKGCQLCAKKKQSDYTMSKKGDSVQKFIEKAKLKHQDENGEPLFNYDEVVYVSMTTPVVLICRNGHRFEQTPNSHLINGCKFCSGSHQSNTEEFIEKSIKKHSDSQGNPKYDYSLVNYERCDIKVKIICKKHGVFEQSPKHHLRGHGCSICGGNMLILSTEEFIEESRKIHGDKYDYSKSIFKSLGEHVSIICPEHGEFLQAVYCHITNKRGCFKCGIKQSSLAQRKPYQKFIEQAEKVHTVIKYDYSRVHENYTTTNLKVKIGCLSCKQFFEQRAKDHLQGQGCRNCKNKTQILFYAFLREQFGEDTFITEKTFNDCKHKNCLPFDFFCEELNLAIELDGRQHFVEVPTFRDTLEERQYKDFIKMKYLLENKISLIRIFQEDVYDNTFNWRDALIESVNMIRVNRDSNFQFIYLSKKNIYDDYKQKFDEFINSGAVANNETTSNSGECSNEINCLEED